MLQWKGQMHRRWRGAAATGEGRLAAGRQAGTSASSRHYIATRPPPSTYLVAEPHQQIQLPAGVVKTAAVVFSMELPELGQCDTCTRLNRARRRRALHTWPCNLAPGSNAGHVTAELTAAAGMAPKGRCAAPAAPAPAAPTQLRIPVAACAAGRREQQQQR